MEKYEISEELYNALVEFYNTRMDMIENRESDDIALEINYDSAVISLMSILSIELEDEDDN